MVKQNNSASKSTSKKRYSCPRMRAINNYTPEKSKKTINKRKRATKTTTEKKIQNSPTRVPKKYFGFAIMRAENDYTLLAELERKKELENRAKANNTTLVCSECKTRSTPLWRKGPKGPKTLCNACGLRLARLEKAATKEDCGKNKSPAKSTGSSSASTGPSSSSKEVNKP